MGVLDVTWTHPRTLSGVLDVRAEVSLIHSYELSLCDTSRATGCGGDKLTVGSYRAVFCEV